MSVEGVVHAGRTPIVVALALAVSCASATRGQRPSPQDQSREAAYGASASAETSKSEVVDAEEETGADWVEDAGVAASRVREAPFTYRCTGHRPRVCELIPSPVCGRLTGAQNDDAGVTQQVEYINGCLACADPSVISYVIGRCAYRGAKGLPTPSSHDEQR